MKLTLNYRIKKDGWNMAEIQIEAETIGEEAILRLLSESKTALISRDSSIHESHDRTRTLYIKPERPGVK